MNQGIPIQQLQETATVPGGSMFLVRMGDGTGTKRVKKEALLDQLATDMAMSYEDSLAFLNAVEDESEVEE